jgi:hypothetical protein
LILPARVVRFGKESHAGGDPENDGEKMSKTYEEAERERLASNPLDCVCPNSAIRRAASATVPCASWRKLLGR